MSGKRKVVSEMPRKDIFTMDLLFVYGYSIQVNLCLYFLTDRLAKSDWKTQMNRHANSRGVGSMLSRKCFGILTNYSRVRMLNVGLENWKEKGKGKGNFSIPRPLPPTEKQVS